MGDEIVAGKFTKKHFQTFCHHLQQETQTLQQWFKDRYFSDKSAVGGFEQEAWLINQQFYPAPLNDVFLQSMQEELLSPELAMFNIELNVYPQELTGSSLSSLQQQLEILWKRCETQAEAMDASLMMIGILPTLRDKELSLQNMSKMNRYHALNERVMSERKGRPLQLNIHGSEHLQSEHHDVMLEAAATSFQIHRQVPLDNARRYYNAAVIASAPVVALSANSPYMFGRQLWEETRIPVFEQAVEVGGYGVAGQGPVRRVTFGSGYVRECISELFIENLQHYPVLLPVELDKASSHLPHLRLHNGTIWRWNRPLIGFDEDDTPHLRIEHRVASAGPTIVDEIANTAFFYGLHEALAKMELAPEDLLEFSQARDNFYKACRSGINAQVTWLTGEKGSLKKLILNQLLPLARKGLQTLQIDKRDADYYLAIIRQRTESERTGAAWQKAFVNKYGHDMKALTEAYLLHQQTGQPIHQWA